MESIRIFCFLSVFTLSRMKIVKYDNPDIICFFVCISDDCLMEIFEMSRIYVGNECIEMKVPERICGGENEYVKWCNELCLNL